MRAEEHELLSGLARGTPMGDLLRRYWTAAVLSRELEADGAPVRVTLLGEGLIAFRDSNGKVGLLEEHCAHRGASLYFGKNANGGLACWYHGWKYDVEGRCLDQPNEPPQTRFCDRVKHKAYPCIERNGVVWTYMGPPDKKPEMPALEWLTVPESHVFVSKRLQQCNWMQGMDGDIDGCHLGFLHGHVIEQVPDLKEFRSAKWLIRDLYPVFDPVTIPSGILLSTRRNAAEDTYYFRVNQWFLPGYTTIPLPGDGPQAGHSWVPRDLGQSWVFTFSWHPSRPLTDAERADFEEGKSAVHAELIPGTFLPIHNRSNEYAGPDAPPAKQPWMRIKNFQDQDMGITESMGALYDRTRESLGSTDIVINQTRRRLMDAARSVQEGMDAPGLNPDDFRFRPYSAELPRSVTNWREAVGDAIETRPETYRSSV